MKYMYFEVILPNPNFYSPYNKLIMETLEIIPLISLLTFSVIFVVVTLLIYDFLRKRGEKVSFIFLRFFMISYADKYKRITKQENHKTGNLYWYWLFSINLALVSFIIYLLIVI
jgi:hypothetical protein